MIKYIAKLFLILLPNCAICQTAIEWSHTYGGSGSDKAFSICNAYTSGYVVGGITESLNGNVTDLHVGNGPNIWLMRVSENGTPIWNRSYGSQSVDDLKKIIQTNDNGYIFIGSCGNNTVDVSGMYPCAHQSYWVVKIDSSGNIVWQKSLGVCGLANGYDLLQTADSNYLVVGRINSGGGDASSFHGFYDIWVCKITPDGNLIWNKTYGGTDIEKVSSICQTSDGNFVILGATISNDLDVTGLHGNSEDIWLIKIDSSGTLLSQKCIGGTGIDEGAKIIASSNNEVYVFATTSSTDGDVSSALGGYDVWIFKCNSSGNILWQGSYGGPSREIVASAIPDVGGGFLILSQVGNDGGMVSGTNGLYDFWLMKIDSLGNFIWGKALGGSNDEEPTDVIQTADGGYLSVGYTLSNNIDIPSNHGLEDFWAIKMESPTLSIINNNKSTMNLQIIRSNHKIIIEFYNNKIQPCEFEFFDLMGRKVLEEKFVSEIGINKIPFDVQLSADGIYLGRLNMGSINITNTCVIINSK